MKNFAVEPPHITSVPVLQPPGKDALHFPVRRIYCVGRNYAEHTREMGGDPTRDAPFFFSKPRDAIVNADATEAAMTLVDYPTFTNNLHYEVELVVAIGKGGSAIDVNDAMNYVYGYAVGIDLTRRDLQSEAKKAGRPWDAAKGFDQSAPISSIVPATADGDADVADATVPLAAMKMQFPNQASPQIWKTENLSISCHVNDELRQQGKLSDMVWSVPEVISILSEQNRLEPGDLIFTGTPSGVGLIVAGDVVDGNISTSTSGDDHGDQTLNSNFAFPSVKFRMK